MNEVDVFRFLPKRRSYRQDLRAAVILAFGAGAFVLLLLSIFLIVQIVLQSSEMLLNLAWSALLSVFATLFCASTVAAVVVSTADIALDADGLHIHLTDSHSTTITAASRTHLKIRKVKPRPFGRKPYQNEVAYAVHCPQLAIWYCLVGFFYGVGLKRIFIVTADHDRHQDLISVLTDSHSVT
jgi:hypothetical protein